MKRMHPLEKAALVTGFLSLIGVCGILYYLLFGYSPTAEKEPKSEYPKREIMPKLETIPDSGFFQNRDSDVPVEGVLVETMPSIITMRKATRAIPGIAVMKQTLVAFPSIKKQLQRQRELMKKLEKEEWNEIQVPENKGNINAEPPPSQPLQKNTDLQQAHPTDIPSKTIEEKPIINPKPLPKPLTKAQERSIVEQAENASPNEVNKKQLMRQSGKVVVREMRKRPDGSLTDQQLEEVFNKIVIQKGEQESDASCVHIQSLPGTEKAAMQISIYLRQKGFIMAGRGEAPVNARGISVDASGKCISVIVGQ